MKKTIGVLIAFLCLSTGSSYGQTGEKNSDLYRIEEITITAGDFTVAGDLFIPIKGAKHPAVVWVHGSGPLTRQMIVPLLMPQIEVFLKAGFAFLIDDIPGSGSSKGAISHVYRDRAMILVYEVAALKRRSDIIPGQIGIAGSSQAGVVMPLALKDSSDIAFMINENGPAENAAEQECFLLEKFMICENYSVQEAQQAAKLLRQRYYAENYKDYREAAEYINNHPAARLLQVTSPLIAEDKFTPPDKSSGMFLDPMNIIAETRIPVLAMFGEKDKNVDPVQGVEAYNKALKAAGNKFYQVEMIPNANHMLYAAQTGCVRELMGQVQKGEPNFSPGALTTLAGWLERLRKRLGN